MSIDKHLTDGEAENHAGFTVFGTADVGALITTRGVYLKNQMKTEQFFGFDLMVIAELRGAFIKDVYINDMKLDTTCMDDDDKAGFVEFINLMAKQFGGR